MTFTKINNSKEKLMKKISLRNSGGGVVKHYSLNDLVLLKGGAK